MWFCGSYFGEFVCFFISTNVAVSWNPLECNMNGMGSWRASSADFALLKIMTSVGLLSESSNRWWINCMAVLIAIFSAS